MPPISLPLRKFSVTFRFGQAISSWDALSEHPRGIGRTKDSPSKFLLFQLYSDRNLRSHSGIKIWMIARLPVAQARLTFGTTLMLSQQPLAACSTSYRPYTCLKMHSVKTMPSVSAVRPLTVRSMASSRNSEEKSWSELASKLPADITAHDV